MPAQTILLIRHGEKTGDKSDVHLTLRGRVRAAALAAFFNPKFNGALPAIKTIYATADSAASHRPRETIEPTAKELGLKPIVAYADKETAQLRAAVSADPSQVVLICWHHEQLPSLAEAFGVAARPAWPGDDVFDRLWTIDCSSEPPSLIDSPQGLIFGDSEH
jgi:broad specificity phosphatase PhoE